MSAPVREPDNEGPSKDSPLSYAPKRARRPDQNQNPYIAPEKVDAAPRQHAPEPVDPPWKRKKQRQAFAGDIAVAELRSRLALTPERLPDPPPRSAAVPKFAVAGRLAGVIVVATVGVVGYRWGAAPLATSPQRLLTLSTNQTDNQGLDAKTPEARLVGSDLAPADHARDPTNGATSVNIGPSGAMAAVLPSTPTQLTSVPPAVASRAIVPSFNEQESHDHASTRPPSRQLTVDAVRPRQADEPARLAISAADAGPNVAVVVSGLAPGSALSAGTPAGPNMWRLSADDFKNAAITPPRGFVGVMDLTLELRLADNSVVDRKAVQLEWSGKSASAPAKSQLRRLEPAEITLMMKNGAEFMSNGNVGAARMMFQPAAEAGDPVAAFALAETYDPLVLKTLGAKGGITPDVALANSWYEKAKELGSPAAPDRLNRLARLRE
jgi:hypothetical protein